MGSQPGFFDLEQRLAGLSAKGDGLERLSAVVDFELFRPELERAVPRADRSQGGRPPFDHVLMFKVLILQTQNHLSDERTEFYLRDRLTWMRFKTTPDPYRGFRFPAEIIAHAELFCGTRRGSSGSATANRSGVRPAWSSGWASSRKR